MQVIPKQRFQPGNLDALRSVQSREVKVQFFLREYDGHTRVTMCRDSYLIHDVVVHDGQGHLCFIEG